MAGGSDAPIETCSPLVGMFDAIHRQARSPPGSLSEGKGVVVVEGVVEGVVEDDSSSSCRSESSVSVEREVFRPEETLTFSEALWIYTVGAAYAAGCESFLGSLEVNFAADFVVLDASVLQDNTLLATTQPKMVVVGGLVSFSEADLLTTINEPDFSTESNEAVPLCGAAAMGGPYVPGKNGKRSYPLSKRTREREGDLGAGIGRALGDICACRMLGKYCAGTG